MLHNKTLLRRVPFNRFNQLYASSTGEIYSFSNGRMHEYRSRINANGGLLVHNGYHYVSLERAIALTFLTDGPSYRAAVIQNGRGISAANLKWCGDRVVPCPPPRVCKVARLCMRDSDVFKVAKACQIKPATCWTYLYMATLDNVCPPMWSAVDPNILRALWTMAVYRDPLVFGSLSDIVRRLDNDFIHIPSWRTDCARYNKARYARLLLQRFPLT